MVLRCARFALESSAIMKTVINARHNAQPDMYTVTTARSLIYYIDTSVLLENIPLVKFIKTTSGTRLVYFP